MEPDRKIRNIGIVAHVDAGKTTLSEAILLRCGAIPVAGTVDDGQATMDFLREEQRRGITIRSAAASFGWKGLRINLVDTPGHVDFGLEVARSLRVLDGAVAVFCGVRGVEPRSLVVWREADAFALPRLAFANKLDVPGADFARLLGQMRESFAQRPVPVVWPILGKDGLEGWVDLVERRALRLRGNELLILPEIPRAWHEAAASWFEELRDAASLFDDELTDLLLAGETPPARLLRRGLREGCRAGKLVPVCAGSALRNVGVDLLLDAVGHYLPAPAVPKAHRDHPGLGLVVHSRETESGTHLALVRAWAGRFLPGAVRRGGGGEGRLVGIWSVLADELRPQDALEAGEIAAVELVGDWRSGDTVLADGPDVVLEPLESRQAVLEVLIEPCDVVGAPVLDAALARMVREDGALACDRDPQTGALRLQGVGELQLDVALTRLREEFGCEILARPPRAVRRERIACASGRLANRLELDGVVIEAWCELEPSSGGADALRCCLVDSEDEALAMVARAAAQEACQIGLCGIGAISGTSWTFACRIAAAQPRRVLHLAKRCLDHLCRQALEAAGAHVEEPLFRVVVNAPHDAVGNVLRELQARGAKVLEIEAGSTGSTITANSLLSSLLGLSILLRSLSKGQAETTLEPLEWVDASVQGR